MAKRKKEKRTNNDLLHITQKTKDRVTRREGYANPSSNCDTLRVTLVYKT
jgi:hypothetical protein